MKMYMHLQVFLFSCCLLFLYDFKEENLQSHTSNIQEPHFGILTVDTFDDQQQPVISSRYNYSSKLWFRIKCMSP